MFLVLNDLIQRYPSVAPLTGQLDDPGRHKLEVVVWTDVLKDPGWVEHEEVECPTLTSVGWAVYEDDKVLNIADTLDEEGTGFGIMALPKGVIMSRKEIK